MPPRDSSGQVVVPVACHQTPGGTQRQRPAPVILRPSLSDATTTPATAAVACIMSLSTGPSASDTVDQDQQQHQLMMMEDDGCHMHGHEQDKHGSN